jgi:2-methylcitrate dehydratase PrpD
MSTEFDESIITRDWGTDYELMSNMYKPFACGLVVHGTIDGCIQLRNEYALEPEMIDRVDIKVSSIVLELTAKANPQTGLEGKFSVFHAAAVALLFGVAGEEQFGDACVQDPRVVALRKKVHIESDESIGRVQSHVFVRLADGRVLERRVEHALGTLERPMSDADLEAKFRALVKDILTEQQSNDLIERCWAVETLPDAGAISAAIAPG